MTKLLKILAMSLAFCASATAAPPADDLREISTIATSSYDPNSEQGREIRSFFVGIGVLFVGPSTDLRKAILEKLDQPALRNYFPDSRERARLAQRVADETKRRHLSNGYNNRATVAALKYSTNELITTIVKRVLEKEGLKDPARAALWASKVLAPFHRCIDQARTYPEGQKCSKPLESDLVKNMGLAMSYELSLQEFGKDFAKARPAEFKACLKPAAAGAESRVKDCALKSVRRAASEFGRQRVLATAKKTMPAAQASRLLGRVMPEFDKCLNGSSERNGFVRCGDKLISKAGSEIAAESIRLDARVAGYFPAAADREPIAIAGRDAFARCMAENEKNGSRDPNGTLQTDNCESFVKMETARTVTLEVLRRTVEENAKGASPNDRAKLLKNATDQLAKCWDSKKPEDKNAACLRTVAQRIAVAVASERLGRELTAESDAPAKDQLLNSFGACLERSIPVNLLASNGTGIEGCAAQVFRDAALYVAETKVRSALTGKVPDPAVVQKMIDTLVKTDFKACLGPAPDETTLDTCSLRLQKNVASQAAIVLVPARVDEFFQANGGLAAYGLEEASRKELIDGVIASHKNCLKTEVKSMKSAQAELEVNHCFKKTIRSLALKLAPLELARSAKENNITVSDELSAEFKGDFAACLDKKQDPSFTLDDYLNGLASCQGQITKTYTVKLAKKELTAAIGQVFNDPSQSAQAEALQGKLFAQFDSCMDKAASSASRDQCISDLRGGAGVELARAGVRSRALKAFETAALPEFVNELEKELDACVEKKQKTRDQCAIEHVKAATVQIGAKIVRGKLKEVFDEAKMNRLEPEIKELEKPFHACVNAAAGPLSQPFLDQLEDCGIKLGESTLEFVMTHMADPAAEEAAPPASDAPPPAAPKPLSEDQLAEMLTRTFLCVNGNLSSEHEEGLQNLTPGSMEQRLLQLIGKYVAYDLQAAHGQAAPVLKKLAEDLAAAGSDTAKARLLDSLVSSGMADQLLRAITRGEIERALKGLPAAKKLPEELEKKLLDKANLDKALSGETMLRIRPILAEGLLKPLLIEGSSVNLRIWRAYTEVRRQALEALTADSDIAPDAATRDRIKNALK